MKKFFKCLMFLTVILNLTVNMSCFAMDLPNENSISMQTVDRLQKIKEKGELTVLSFNIVPYSYRDSQTGEFSGFDAEIIKEVAKRLGVKKVNVKYISLSNALQEFINDPNIDLVAQEISITDERKKLLAFTIPMYTQSDVMLTLKNSNINSKEDLKGKTIGILGGTTYEDIVKDWKNKGVIKDFMAFYDNNSLILALENKTIDAIMTESLIAKSTLLSKTKSNFKLLSPNQYKPEISSYSAYPLKKEDVTLLNAINEKLQEMKSDGTIYEIFSKYALTEDYIPK